MTALLEPISPRLLRFTGAMFDQMLENGILPDDARLELLDGWIVELPEVKQNHANRIKHLYDELQRLFSSQADVYAQCPVRLPQDGRPLPDVMLIRQGAAAVDTPVPQDVLLLVEVAGSSLHDDKTVKLPLYARDGIQEYWIVDLNAEVLHIFRKPEKEQYLVELEVKDKKAVACLAFPDQPVNWLPV